MPYTYLDHEADVGLESTGASIEEAIESGVQGMLDLMADTDGVRPSATTPVTAEGSDPATLFVATLNAVLAERDIAGQFFHCFRVDRVDTRNGRWHLAGTLWGEPVDPSRHSIGNEVKAATYSGLRFTQEPGVVRLRCVLDI
jgi:SHS2 domain-containing protein